MKSDLRLSQNWYGVWTALVTPFKLKSKKLSLDLVALEELLERQIADGILGFVMAGSTGEGSLLTPEDYFALLKKTRSIVGKRAFIVAGLGIGGTRQCLANLALAKQAKVDGLLASPPAYIKTPEGLLEKHFLTLAQEKIPLCLYEIPGRAASSMSVSFLKNITRTKGSKGIVALKDATGSMPRISEESTELGERLALLSGDDGTFAPFLRGGGRGIISVATHFFPKTFQKILAQHKAGKAEEAEKIQAKLNPFIDALFWESNPIPCKSLAAKLGWISNNLFAPPLGPMDPAKLKLLIDLYRNTKKELP